MITRRQLLAGILGYQPAPPGAGLRKSSPQPM